MKGFFKTFLAVFVALVVFALVFLFVGIVLIGRASSEEKPVVGKNAVLYLDLSVDYADQSKDNTVNSIVSDEPSVLPGLSDVVQMIDYAKGDSSIKGIFIRAVHNSNSFAASEELRRALKEFKSSRKFIIAYGDAISQGAYGVASIADKIYCNPKGGVEWRGYANSLAFFKGALDKLELQPEVFYAGKFKSATEPFRYTQMSDANRLQTTVWVNDLYSRLLLNVAESRGIDTATLHKLAADNAVQSANDALAHHLVDGLKYDDEVKAELFERMGAKEVEKVNFVSIGKYYKAVDFSNTDGEKIAVIYASGDIVSGKGSDEQIGSDKFKNLIRKARLDKNVKAIVLRVNSPGGDALASEVIWREVSLARKVKPTVVSMGDLAASGGYYISCNGDSIFADASTITGSIGVFSLTFNVSSFFKNKLGTTFDGVKTTPSADMQFGMRPLTEQERSLLQSDVDTVYQTFISRVAEGRKKPVAYIDSIAQGRVWTGQRAVSIGLVDKIGNLQDAIACAARMAKVKEYYIKEYPERKSFWEQLTSGSAEKTIKTKMISEEIGEDGYKLMQHIKAIKSWDNIPQARLPFDYTSN
ncbi:signal peptide peptidase SppA [Filimonas lacunae]|nr:signal peptide peptidase SppA [Filimonas lacunae]